MTFLFQTYHQHQPNIHACTVNGRRPVFDASASFPRIVLSLILSRSQRLLLQLANPIRLVNNFNSGRSRFNSEHASPHQPSNKKNTLLSSSSARHTLQTNYQNAGVDFKNVIFPHSQLFHFFFHKTSHPKYVSIISRRHMCMIFSQFEYDILTSSACGECLVLPFWFGDDINLSCACLMIATFLTTQNKTSMFP